MHTIAVYVAVEGVNLVANTSLIERLSINIPISRQVESWALSHLVALRQDDLLPAIPLHEQKVRIGALDEWFHFV